MRTHQMPSRADPVITPRQTRPAGRIATNETGPVDTVTGPSIRPRWTAPNSLHGTTYPSLDDVSVAHRHPVRRGGLDGPDGTSSDGSMPRNGLTGSLFTWGGRSAGLLRGQTGQHATAATGHGMSERRPLPDHTEGVALQRAKGSPKFGPAPDKVFYSVASGFHQRLDIHKRSRTAFGTFGSKHRRQGPHTSPHVLNRFLIARIGADLDDAKGNTKQQHAILDKLKFTRLVPRPNQQLHTAGRVVPAVALTKYGDMFHKRNRMLYDKFTDNKLDPHARLRVLGQYLEHNILQTYKHGKTPTPSEIGGKGESMKKAARWTEKDMADEALDPNTMTSIQSASTDPKRDKEKAKKRVRQILKRARNIKNDNSTLSDDSDDDK